MNRYEQIIEKLDEKMSLHHRVCRIPVCACRGCCGTVGAKRITEQELALYNSGEMGRIVEGQKS